MRTAYMVDFHLAYRILSGPGQMAISTLRKGFKSHTFCFLHAVHAVIFLEIAGIGEVESCCPSAWSCNSDEAACSLVERDQSRFRFDILISTFP